METNSVNKEILYNERVNNNISLNKIKEDLVEQGYADSSIEKIIADFNKHLDQKRTICGFKCMAGGGAFCFTSLFLTFLNVFPEMRSLTLYGLTFVGIITGIIGMYLLLEKREIA